MTRQAGRWLAAALMGAVAGLSACAPDGAGPVEEKDAAALAVPGRTAQLALACSGCHGPSGGAIVSLEGYSKAELSTALTLYKSDEDGTTVMNRLMRGYSAEDIEAISTYLADEGPR
ncbi:hypothetical protein D1227_00480 [Henriciella mobilis]|uniref:c-type cytochrome n=1 Tax=Henriciella mobilis TaxID=2305467 RepID=UPI000E666223|nr:hypothetical protein [Henriciella mobilis]RIJ18315.1 hypothetical protein D1231_03175 [Henriciella mobilis]RIJ24881.1 hypothetical protein D1227_00480 [Henriciella mobilis]